MGINQQTLADLASVAVNTVVAIERGEGNPQLDTLLTILDTLGLQIDINIKLICQQLWLITIIFETFFLLRRKTA